MRALFLIIIFGTLLAFVVAHDVSQTRRLQQQKPVEIRKENVDKLQPLVDDADDGTTFVFREDVLLPDLIKVNTTGLTFRGDADLRPTLRCTNEKGAFLVMQNGTTFENLIIRGCQKTAVSVQHDATSADPFAPGPDIKDIQPIMTTFREMDFLENGGLSVSQSPGAILAKEKSMLEIKECRFESNKGTFGGAISFYGQFLDIQGTDFVNNSARDSGGAIYGYLDRNADPKTAKTSTFQLQDCRFFSNEVFTGRIDRQGLLTQDALNLEVNTCIKFDLPADSGGALYLRGYETVKIDTVAFVRNKAVSAGGAIYLSDNPKVDIRTCIFLSNEALPDNEASNPLDAQLGGAIFAPFSELETEVQITSCNFTNNSAAYGGALHVVSPSTTKFELQQCSFTQNMALLGGGAIVFRNIERPLIQSSRFRNNTAFAGGALFITNGGGVITGDKNPKTGGMVFDNNAAYDGGAIYGTAFDSMLLRGRFERNRAYRKGGGICLIDGICSVDSRADRNFYYQEAQMYNNSAYSGGAIYAENLNYFTMIAGGDPEYVIFKKGEIDDTKNEFIENTAVEGGAIYFKAYGTAKNAFLLNKALFLRNAAVEDEMKIVQESFPESIIKRYEGKTPSKNKNLQSNLLKPRTMEACEPGGGGAICMVLSSAFDQIPTSVEISDSEFTDNEANVGGAMVISTDVKARWDSTCEDNSTLSSPLTTEPCRRLVLRRLRFEQNFAKFAGGAIMATHFPHLHFVNDDSLNFKTIEELNREDYFKKNMIGKDGYGPDVAGTAVRLNIFAPKENKNSAALIDNQPSGSTSFLPRIEVELLDGLNQRVTAGIIDSVFTIDAESIDPRNETSIASGQVISEAVQGVATFETLALSAPNGTYELVFSVNNDDVKPAETNVTLRDCILGERYNPAGYVCERCTYETFTIYKDVPKCESCPSHAKCAGNASWVPEDGYWHSSPLSVIMLECLHDKACKYKDRTKTLEAKREKNLETFMQRFEELENPVFNNSEYPQCEVGYEGPLCGSCNSGYGHVNGKMCIQCGNRILSVSIVFLTAVWQMVLISITIRSALVSIRDMGQLLLLQQQQGMQSHDRPQLQQPMSSVPAPAPDTSNSTSADDIHVAMDGEGASVIPLQPANNASRRNITANEVEALYSSRHLSVRVNTPQPTPAQQHSADYIIAAQHISETIKIFVNFFQITSVAVNINLGWTEALKKMSNVMNSIAGFSSGASFSPMVCAVDTDSENRSIYGILLRIVFPIGLMFFVMSFFCIRWAFCSFSNRQLTIHASSLWLKSQLVITFLVVAFYSYQSISEDLMTIVNCIHLDLPEMDRAYAFDDPETNVNYSQFSIANGYYWTEDTKIQCKSRAHAFLVGFLAVPGIVLFILGIPLYLFVFLLFQKSKGNLTKLDILNTYGFIYQNYTDKFVFWEVMILMRKAMIGVVVVFAYPLGSNLQGIMALGILVVSLGFHLVAMPFKYLPLNILEALSLLVSFFTFYCGVVFNDENTSETARIVLSIGIMTINSILVLIFVVTICLYSDKYLSAKLKYLGQSNVPNNTVLKLMRLATMISGQVKTVIRDQFHKA